MLCTYKRKLSIDSKILIKDNNRKVTMVTITPDHKFKCTNETDNWDIVNGAKKQGVPPFRKEFGGIPFCFVKCLTNYHCSK